MALGISITKVALTGNYIDFEGNPIAGQVIFSMAEVLRDGTDDQLIAPSVVVAPLVNGSFTVTLPATNDPDVVPNPFVYTVVESFPNGRTYTISLPYTTSGSLDLADISPDTAFPNPAIALVDAVTWGVLKNEIDTQAILLSVENSYFVNLPTDRVTAQGYATTASANLVTVQNNLAGTLNPLMLIGG
jgi:hypothetical protein